MAFTNLEKDVYSKTPNPLPPPPPANPPPSCKVDGILAPKIKSHLATAAFAIEYVYPADRVTNRSIHVQFSNCFSYSPGSGRLFTGA